ncbi:MAG TPA: Wzz/FepE/Etk N-terminal domain-containing protein [Candidatus Angelobacter sp.]
MQTTKIDPDLQVALGGSALDDEKGADLIDRLTVIGDHKTFIFTFVTIATVVAIVVALWLPYIYQATTKIMPPQQNPSAATALLAQLGPLAALAPRDLNLRSPSELYIDMLRSRVVADGLVQRFSLIQVYRCKDIEMARSKLQSASEINAARDGLISIGVSDGDPKRAADIANGYVEELQKLTQTLGVTEAGRRRLFFEHEVQKVNEELANAEQSLKQTQEKTGMIQLDSQAKAMIEAMVRLRSQVASKEAQVQAMRIAATDKNPALMRAESELASLRAQQARFEAGQTTGSIADFPMGKVPSAGLEYIRKLREVRYRESLLEALTKEYEIARIDEAKDASIIQVLEPAVPPLRRISPRRTVIVAVTMFSALFVAITFVLFAESIERARQDPVRAVQLQRLKYSFWWGRRS